MFQRFKELSPRKTAILISRTASRASAWPTASSSSPTARWRRPATHEELVAQRGRYAELFELQAAGYR